MPRKAASPKTPNARYSRAAQKALHPSWHVAVLGAAGLSMALTAVSMAIATSERANARALMEQRANFCAVQRVVPADFLCTDPAKCQTEAVFLSSAALVTNGVTRSYCPNASNQITLRVPDDVLSPSDAALDEIRATMALWSPKRRDKALQRALAEREAFVASRTGQGGPE